MCDDNVKLSISQAQVVHCGDQSGHCVMCLEHAGTGADFSASVPASSNLLFH